MALKQVDQVRYDAIAAMVKTVSGLGHDYETVKQAVQSQLDDFEAATRKAIRIKSDFSLEIIDRRKDFMRIRQPNEEASNLKTKVDGVAIDVKVFKEGDFNFENATIAQSLRRLADTVASLPAELSSLPECEVEDYVQENFGATDSEASSEEGTDESAIESFGLGTQDEAYVADPQEAPVARFEEEETEGHHEGSGFSFQGSLDHPLGDEEDTEADRLLD